MLYLKVEFLFKRAQHIIPKKRVTEELMEKNRAEDLLL